MSLEGRIRIGAGPHGEGTGLHDSTHRPGFADVIGVEERDAATGKLIVRSTKLRNLLSINSVSATVDGVWLSYATAVPARAPSFVTSTVTTTLSEPRMLSRDTLR